MPKNAISVTNIGLLNDAELHSAGQLKSSTAFVRNELPAPDASASTTTKTMRRGDGVELSSLIESGVERNSGPSCHAM